MRITHIYRDPNDIHYILNFQATDINLCVGDHFTNLGFNRSKLFSSETSTQEKA